MAYVCYARLSVWAATTAHRLLPAALATGRRATSSFPIIATWPPLSGTTTAQAMLYPAMQPRTVQLAMGKLLIALPASRSTLRAIAACPPAWLAMSESTNYVYPAPTTARLAPTCPPTAHPVSPTPPLPSSSPTTSVSPPAPTTPTPISPITNALPVCPSARSAAAPPSASAACPLSSWWTPPATPPAPMATSGSIVCVPDATHPATSALSHSIPVHLA
jgi:hypothetical protein